MSSLGAQLRARLGEVTGFTITRSPSPGTLAHHLRLLFSRFEFDLLVDVGAHRGEFGELARHSGYRGRIVSYDPEPGTELSEHASGLWEVRPVACSDRAGSATLHRYDAGVFNSLHEPNDLNEERFGGKRVLDDRSIVTVRLDEEALPGERIFLKIDAQGHDRHVLEGARGLLDRVQVIQMELAFMPIYEGAALLSDLVGVLADLGFTPSGIFPVSRASDHLRIIECDCVAVRGSTPPRA